MPITLGTGIFSGLDTAQIINDLMAVERQPLERMTLSKAGYETKISSWGTISGLLASVQSSLSSLKSDSLATRAATSGDTSAFTATATSSAGDGNYQITVNRLATSQSLYSGRFDLSTSEVADLSVVTSQNLRIQVGSGESTELTIDSTNNTLSSLRDAINDADAGVTASILYDGTGYRLALAGSTTGTGGRIKITVDEDADAVFGESGAEKDLTGLSRLAFDPTYDADGNATGGATVTSPVTGATVAANALSSGDLILNDVSVGASVAADDTFSSVGNAASAIAKAAAINDGTGSHGVTATVNANTVAGGTAGTFTEISAGDIQINGISVGAVTAGTTAATQGANVAAAIQAVSAQTGVTAAADADGKVTLTAADGRNIQITQAGTATTSTTGLTAAVTYGTLTLTSGSDIVIDGAAPDNAGLPSGMIQSQAAVDASLLVDGLTVTRSSNTISDLITGVTIELKGTSSSSAALTVAEDRSAISDGLDAFVSAYNEAMETVTGVSYASKEGEPALLTGDSTARSIITDLKSAITSDYGENSLVSLGVSHDRHGVLSLDTSLLSDALDEDTDGVIASLNAMAEWLDDSLDDYVKTGIPARTDGLSASIKRVETDMENLGDRLAIKESRLRQRFLLLEQTLGQMQQDGDFMSQQMAALSSMTSGKK